MKSARKSERHSIDYLPGYVANLSKGTPIAVIPVDISRTGIGIMSSATLVPESRVEFSMEDESVETEVVWCMSGRWVSEHRPEQLASEKVYRYGLKTVNDKDDLLHIFRIS
jgi:hypothetical protein